MQIELKISIPLLFIITLSDIVIQLLRWMLQDDDLENVLLEFEMENLNPFECTFLYCKSIS